MKVSKTQLRKSSQMLSFKLYFTSKLKFWDIIRLIHGWIFQFQSTSIVLYLNFIVKAIKYVSTVEQICFLSKKDSKTIMSFLLGCRIHATIYKFHNQYSWNIDAKYRSLHYLFCAFFFFPCPPYYIEMEATCSSFCYLFLWAKTASKKWITTTFCPQIKEIVKIGSESN